MKLTEVFRPYLKRFLTETMQPILPWLLRNENEVQNIFEFFKYKIKEREDKDEHGGRILNGFQAVENQARLALPSDIVQFIEKSLTKDEMKKKAIDRRRKIYPVLNSL